ncbi:hypothetical protein C8R44DRAFT_774989 [Mycena epipterygia]|nr:hypothetical protein C8R44DRAFT_774989 [Mycena epipterygia]
MEEVLQDFIQIYDAVSGVSRRVLNRQPTVDSTCGKPDNCPPHSRAPGAQFRILASDVGLPPSFERAVPWQLATIPSSMGIPSIQNALIWSCHDVLREDARRRFISASQRIRSSCEFSSFPAPTNLLHRRSASYRIIYMILGFAFATPEDLRYDTSMSCFIDEAETIQYRLIVDSAAYITKKMLSDNRAAGESFVSGRHSEKTIQTVYLWS